MANKVATIGWLRQKVAGTPIQITPIQGDTYCPTYNELMNGSIIPTIHIKIPRYSVGDSKGVYSSNQLVCEIDIDLVFYSQLTVNTNYDGIVTAYTNTQTATAQTVNKTAVFNDTFIIGENVTVIVPCPPDGAPVFSYTGLTPTPDKLTWASGDTSTKTITVSGIKNESEYSTYEKGTGFTVMKDVTVIDVYHSEIKHPSVTTITYPKLTTGVTSSYPFKITLKSAETNTYNVVPPTNPLDVDQTGFLNFYSNDLNYYDASAEVIKENSGKTFDITILSNSGGTTTVSIDGVPNTYPLVGSGSNWSAVVPIHEKKNVVISRTQPTDYTSGGTKSYNGLFPSVKDLLYTETGTTQTVTYNGTEITSPVSSITWSVPTSAFTSLNDNKVVNLPLTSSVTETVNEKTATTTPNVTLLETTSNGFTANSTNNVVTITAPRTKQDIDVKGSFVVTASSYNNATIYTTLSQNEYYTLSLHSNSGGTVTVVVDGVAKTYELKGSGTNWSNEAKVLKGSKVQITRTIPQNETIGGITTYEGLTPVVTSITYSETSKTQSVTYLGTVITTAVSSVTWSCPSTSVTINGDFYFDMPLTNTTKQTVASSSTITYPKVVLNNSSSNGFTATANNNIVSITSPNTKKDTETNGTFVVTASNYNQAVINAILKANIYYTLTINSNSGGTAYVSVDGTQSNYELNNGVASVKVLEGSQVIVTRNKPNDTSTTGATTYIGLNPVSSTASFTTVNDTKTFTYSGSKTTGDITNVKWSSESGTVTMDGNKSVTVNLSSAVTTTQGTTTNVNSVSVSPSSSNGFTATANGTTVTIKAPTSKTSSVQSASFSVTQSLDSHITDGTINASLSAEDIPTVTGVSVNSVSIVYPTTCVSYGGGCVTPTTSVTYTLHMSDGSTTTSYTTSEVTTTVSYGGSANSNGQICFTNGEMGTSGGRKTGTTTVTISGTKAVSPTSKTESDWACQDGTTPTPTPTVTGVSINSISLYYPGTCAPYTGGCVNPTTSVTYTLHMSDGSTTTSYTTSEVTTNVSYGGSANSNGQICFTNGEMGTSGGRKTGTTTISISGTKAVSPTSKTESDWACQDGTTPTPTCELSVSTTSLTIPSSGTEGSITVTSNSGISVSDNQDWITVSTGTNKVNYTISENTSTSGRSGKITVSNGCGESVDINVSQNGATPPPPEPIFDCEGSQLILSTKPIDPETETPETEYEFPTEGGSRTLYAYFKPKYTDGSYGEWETCTIS